MRIGADAALVARFAFGLVAVFVKLVLGIET
jgi:hypothetical protein